MNPPKAAEIQRISEMSNKGDGISTKSLKTIINFIKIPSEIKSNLRIAQELGENIEDCWSSANF